MNIPLKSKTAIGSSIVSRRKFLNLTSQAFIGGTILANISHLWATSPPNTEQKLAHSIESTFGVAPLSYSYDALEPIIDAETMHVHHDKHYATYTKNLNEALTQVPEFKSLSIVQLLSCIPDLPPLIQNTIRNNGGGYYNHTWFWEWMTPHEKGNASDSLNTAINKAFGNFTNMRAQFNHEAASIFGSGWAWLIVDQDKGLKITSTANQDNPLMKGIAKNYGTPILGLDVWEHAYYLKYKNERAKYIAAWWDVINWKTVNSLFSASA